MRDFEKSSWGDRIASRYESFYGRHVDPESVVNFLADLGVGKSGIMDVGAGTGRVAELLAQRLDLEIAALDVSEAMLAILHQRGEKRLIPIQLDICDHAPEVTVDLAYCIFNTLFMVGDAADQLNALKNVRSVMDRGGLLVIDAFQPVGDFYRRDSFTVEPLDMSADEILMTFTRVRADDRIIEGQDVYMTPSGNVLAPCMFHYRSIDEIDVDAEAAGWRLVDRYADWSKGEFAEASESVLSVYEAV